MHDVERARKWYESGKRWQPKLTCPDGKPCKRGDTFLRHDIEDPYSSCFGETCCMTCSRGTSKYYSCQRRCSKCEAVRKDERDKAKEAEAKRKEKALNEVKIETTKSAKRIVKALDAAGIQDDVKITVASNWWSNSSFSAGTIRAMAAGVFEAGFDATEDPFRVKRLTDRLPELCELLKCSADYLIGRTDTPQSPMATLESTPIWRDPMKGQLPADGETVIGMLQYDRPYGKWLLEYLDYIDGKWKNYGFAVPDDVRILWQPEYDPDDDVPNSGTTEESEEAENG